jgi:hypothetical protein
MGDVDSEPIPDELAAERNNRALCGQVVTYRILTWVSVIGGNTKAALVVSLPLACTWHETMASSGLGLGPFLLHPQQYHGKYFFVGHRRRCDVERGNALP